MPKLIENICQQLNIKSTEIELLFDTDLHTVNNVTEIFDQIKENKDKLYYTIVDKRIQYIEELYIEEPTPDIGYMEIKLVRDPTKKALIGFNSIMMDKVYEIIKVANYKLNVDGKQLWTLDCMVIPNIEFVILAFNNNSNPGFLLATEFDIQNPPDVPDIGYVNVNLWETEIGQTLGVYQKTTHVKFLEEASIALGIKGVEFWDSDKNYLDLIKIKQLIQKSNTKISTIYLISDDIGVRKKLGYIVIQKASLLKTVKSGIMMAVFNDADILNEGSKKLNIEGKVIWDEHGNPIDDKEIKNQIRR